MEVVIGMNISMHNNIVKKQARNCDKEKAVLFSVIKQAREKLEIYRDHSDGAYHGGIEHTALIRNIDTALAMVPVHTQPPVYKMEHYSIDDVHMQHRLPLKDRQ